MLGAVAGAKHVHMIGYELACGRDGLRTSHVPALLITSSSILLQRPQPKQVARYCCRECQVRGEEVVTMCLFAGPCPLA